MKTQFTPGQKLMLEDGCPAFLLIPPAQRAKAWEKIKPVVPVVVAPDSPALKPTLSAKDQEFVKAHLDETEAAKKAKQARHFAKLKASKAAKERREAQDAEELRKYEERYENAWVEYETIIMKEESAVRKAIRVFVEGQDTPYDRAKTSVPADAGEAIVQQKVRGAAIRAGVKKVTRVEVLSPEGEVVETWKAGEDKTSLLNSATSTAIPLVSAVEQPEEGQMATKKSKSKSKAKKANGTGAKKGPGVIATIIETMKRDRGATIEEMVGVLKGKFPSRSVKGMTSTCKIQAAKNAKKKDKDEKRGLVYFA